MANPGPQVVRTVFVVFVQSQQHLLWSLTLKSFEHIDRSSAFEELGHLPCLKELHISAAINKHRLSQSSTFTGFLRAHKNTLKSLSIQPGFERWLLPQDATYGTWVNIILSAHASRSPNPQNWFVGAIPIDIRPSTYPPTHFTDRHGPSRL
jgi:hypothetical protein